MKKKKKKKQVLVFSFTEFGDKFSTFFINSAKLWVPASPAVFFSIINLPSFQVIEQFSGPVPKTPPKFTKTIHNQKTENILSTGYKKQENWTLNNELKFEKHSHLSYMLVNEPKSGTRTLSSFFSAPAK